MSETRSVFDKAFKLRAVRISYEAGSVSRVAPALAIISGPIFTNSEYAWAGPSITARKRAQARLYYLDPVDIRPGKATRAYTAFRAYAQALHTQVEIRFDPLNADRFAINTLGRDARCIKSWDDAAEE